MKKVTIFSIFTFMTLLSIAPVGFALYPSTTPWSMYRYDTAHTGATISGAPDNNNTLWAAGFSTSGLSNTATPLIVEGRVIFQVRDLAIAVDETTGVELWRHQTSGVLTASTYADGESSLAYQRWPVESTVSTPLQAQKSGSSPFLRTL
jgi:hypothetical protein